MSVSYRTFCKFYAQWKRLAREEFAEKYPGWDIMEIDADGTVWVRMWGVRFKEAVTSWPEYATSIGREDLLED